MTYHHHSASNIISHHHSASNKEKKKAEVHLKEAEIFCQVIEEDTKCNHM